MPCLRKTLNEYLEIRRGLGFKLKRTGMWLPKFVYFIERHKGEYITNDFTLRWVKSESTSSRAQLNRLMMVRGFAKYVYALDSRTQIPSRKLLAVPTSNRFTPYVYTSQDIAALINAATMLHGLCHHTYATLIGLLAVTGMRTGEAIALDRSDIDWQKGTITIRNSKFGKSRQLPLHSSTVAALRRYEEKRNEAVPRPASPSFFLSLNATRLKYQNAHFIFLKLVRVAGLWNRRPHRPRIHDLRHSFIISVITKWYKAGLNVESKMAALSTYVGHVAPSSTYWYLTATPELLGQAKNRFENSLGVLP